MKVRFLGRQVLGLGIKSPFLWCMPVVMIASSDDGLYACMGTSLVAKGKSKIGRRARRAGDAY